MSDIAIIILNWNGWRDTCECIASILMNNYQSYQIIIIDNGSSDNSVKYIQSWIKGDLSIEFGINIQKYIKRKISLTTISLNHFDKSSIGIKENIILIKSEDNLGFAKAANYGIRYAIKNGFKYTFLLNNDTTIESDCLHSLVSYTEMYPDRPILSPIIYYYDAPERIWYFGGKLTFTGRRAIFEENQKRKDVQNQTKNITFISGCALFSRTIIFIKYGFLTEKFFFGEEDYEFSLRMKEQGIIMQAISSAKVYHKVSVSNKKMFGESRLSYMLIGYLNRFIDKKIHTKSMLYYDFWRLICCLYIAPKLLIFHKYTVKDVLKLVKYLILFSSRYDSAPQELFYKIINILG